MINAVIQSILQTISTWQFIQFQWNLFFFDWKYLDIRTWFPCISELVTSQGINEERLILNALIFLRRMSQWKAPKFCFKEGFFLFLSFFFFAFELLDEGQEKREKHWQHSRLVSNWFSPISSYNQMDTCRKKSW